MKKFFSLLAAIVVAFFTTSCSVPVPGGRIMVGPEALSMMTRGVGGGQRVQQSQGYQQQGQRIVDNGGYFSRSKWQNGVDRHHYTPGVSISARNGALNESERKALAIKLDAWVIARMKAGGNEPTEAEVTAEAKRLVGHNNVHAHIDNHFSEEHIAQERKLISRERVDAEDVPEDARQRLQSKARENFYKHRTNKMVKDGEFYPVETE